MVPVPAVGSQNSVETKVSRSSHRRAPIGHASGVLKILLGDGGPVHHVFVGLVGKVRHERSS